MKENWALIEYDLRGLSVTALVKGDQLTLHIAVEKGPSREIEFEKKVRISKIHVD